VCDYCRYLLYGAIVIVVIIFLATNITCAAMVHATLAASNVVRAVSITRVAINDGLFLLLAVILSVCIYRVSRISSVSIILEAKASICRLEY
jgi:hypothetical protein